MGGTPIPSMVSALCPTTTSVPWPANTTATSCPTSNDPFAAIWRGIEHVVGSLVPVVTILGLQISVLLAGAVLVENVFSLPGMGRLAYQALAQRDLIVIKNVVLFLSAIVIVVNLIVDSLYIVLAPRLRATVINHTRTRCPRFIDRKIHDDVDLIFAFQH